MTFFGSDSKLKTVTVDDQFVLVPKSSLGSGASGAAASAQGPVVGSEAGVKGTDAKSSVSDRGAPVTPSVRLAALFGKLGTGRGATMGLKLGLKPLRIALPISLDISNTAGNLTAAVVAVDVTSSTEWAALASLYDEYRFVRGWFQYQPFANNAGFTSPSSTSDTMFLVSWDPVDATALSSVRNGCELAQHQLLAGAGADTTASAISIESFVPSTAHPQVFRWKPSKAGAVTVSASGAVNSWPGMWKQVPTAGSNGAPDGYLKFYNYNGLASATRVCTGVLFYEVELRSRK